ncbi:hypothetical protein BV25DRAFT_1529452 [Artomyces pyxidatus]|uniref:Uncharacterized protein n=1 Tax=Artomyces pyxidatus TaxID=48021 RepID=A0ACB8TCV3_9AGAM|nr:hypothetical protein BV25DRAFT_1529452 [Artomyces pyxidatus]
MQYTQILHGIAPHRSKGRKQGCTITLIHPAQKWGYDLQKYGRRVVDRQRRQSVSGNRERRNSTDEASETATTCPRQILPCLPVDLEPVKVGKVNSESAAVGCPEIAEPITAVQAGLQHCCNSLLDVPMQELLRRTAGGLLVPSSSSLAHLLCFLIQPVPLHTARP